MKNSNDYEASKKNWIRFIIIGFSLLFVAIFSGGPCYQIINSFIIDKEGVNAIGKVNSIQHLSSTDIEAVRYSISFEYKGKQYRIFNKIMSNESIYTLNERVHVKFMPDNPEEAIINSNREKYTGWILPIAIGAIMLSLILFHFVRRK
jgi:hypothetical protein